MSRKAHRRQRKWGFLHLFLGKSQKGTKKDKKFLRDNSWLGQSAGKLSIELNQNRSMLGILLGR